MVNAYRWWSLADIKDAPPELTFVPRALAVLLPPILTGAYPAPPLDAGI